MKEISWSDAFFSNLKLRNIRTENNLNIPQEYNRAVHKMAVAACVWCFVLGMILGVFIRGV